MAPSSSERVVEAFYDWETRGRGWLLWPDRVALEPPFRPFTGHVWHASTTDDDGRVETSLGRFAEGIKSLFGSSSERPAPERDEELEEAAPVFSGQQPEFCEIQISLPKDSKPNSRVFEQCLFSLGNHSWPTAFEIIGDESSIVVQLATPECQMRQLELQIAAHFPEATLTHTRQHLAEIWSKTNSGYGVVLDMGLEHEFMTPLKTMASFATDPLVGICAAMETLARDDAAIFQVLFQPVSSSWAESALRAVSDGHGRPFFIDAPELTKQTTAKLATPLFAVVIRVATSSNSEQGCIANAKSLVSAMEAYSSPNGNSLIPLDGEGLDHATHLEDVFSRATHRSGMLLNSEELLALAHLPTDSVRSPRLLRTSKKTKASPKITEGHRLVLGTNEHAGRRKEVTLCPDQRVRHMHVIGASGTGKSTLLLNLILSDIQSGEGLAVLDPHGDLIDEVLGRIPDNRINDVVLLDAADEEYAVGFNILQAHSELEKNLLSSDLVAVFRRLSTSWGDQMNSVLANAILAFLESTEGGTLTDLRRFLLEKDYRSQFLQTVQDPDIVYFWTKQFTSLTNKSIGPILTRLDILLRPKPIRHMVSQRENRLDFSDIMDSGKIFLARLPQGAIGDENAYLLGSLLVTKFHQSIMGRQAMAKEDRRSFWLYLDEFHHFVTPSMSAILSGARKYQLGMILAHQELRQLQTRDTEVASSILSNCYTRLCFRLGTEDSRKLANDLSFFEASDLQNLGRGEAIGCVERSTFDFNLSVSPPTEVADEAAKQTALTVRKASRTQYAVPRGKIDHPSPTPTQPTPKKDANQKQITPPQPQSAKPMEEKTTLPPSMETDSSTDLPTTPPSPPTTPNRATGETEESELNLSGRGGSYHRHCQNLIKLFAEGLNYRAILEMPTTEGKSVDVALIKDDLRIACEISVSTPAPEEAENITKCIRAGFGHVIHICSNPHKALSIRKRLRLSLGNQSQLNIHFFSQIQEVCDLLLSLEAASQSDSTCSKGLKVQTSVSLTSPETMYGKKQRINQIIARAIRRTNQE